MQIASKIRHGRSLNTVWISLIRQKDFLLAMRDHEYSKPQKMVSVQSMRAISDRKDSLIVVIETIQPIN